MKSRFIAKIPIIYITIAFVIAIVSWMGNIYGLDVRNLLSADGIKWFVEHFIGNIYASPLSAILILLMSLGVCVESRIFVCMKGHVSPKRRYALRFTLVILLVYCLVILLLTFGTPSILLSVFGTYSNSPLSKGILGLILLGLLILGNSYGFLSGRFLEIDDFISAHCALVKKCAPYFITVVAASQLTAFIDYVFCGMPNVWMQTISFFLYYSPLALYLPLIKQQ